MRRALVERHPDLFEPDSPQIEDLPSDQKQDLVLFIGAMLIEIVTVPMTARESDDDKDYA